MEYRTDHIQTPPDADEYLDALSAVLPEEHVRSVLVYGSAVRGEIDAASDLDLLIVLREETPSPVVDQVRTAVRRLNDEERETDQRVERWIEPLIGLFSWGHVTTEERLSAPSFAKIFGAPRIADWLIPWRIVLYSICSELEPIYGEEIEIGWLDDIHPSQRWGREWVKSFLTAFLFTAVPVLYQLVSRRAIDYAQSGYKASLEGCELLVSGQDSSIAAGISHVAGDAHIHTLFRRVRHGTASPADRLAFILLAPLGVAAHHLQALRHRFG